MIRWSRRIFLILKIISRSLWSSFKTEAGDVLENQETKGRMKSKLWITVSLAGLLCGCTPLSRPIDQDKVRLIKKGESTEADVVRLLGRPRMTSLNDGPQGMQKILTYSYLHKSQMFGVMLGVQDTAWQTASFAIGTNGMVESIQSMVGTTVEPTYKPERAQSPKWAGK